MQTIGAVLKQTGLFTPISETQKTCEKHGIEYTEKVYPRFTQGCPKCKEERDAQRQAEAEQEQEAKKKAHELRVIEERLGLSRIPPRFQDKTVKGYVVEPHNQQQIAVVERIKAYAHEFSGSKHSGRNLALLGNAGTGKTHLACAIGNHVIRNCGGHARFTSVAEINRVIRQAKSFDSHLSEAQVIEAFAKYDLLIIDEVGVQSGTEAESRALFDVFNERYQQMKPTILISNLDAKGFVAAVGDRIADRVKEDGGELLLFNWSSYRA